VAKPCCIRAMLYAGFVAVFAFAGNAQAEPEARKLFGARQDAAPLAARAIGYYSRGCLSGAKPISVDGPAWQVMRLSRNRNWGHPKLISLVERLAVEAQAQDGWRGLLVGDLAQPRGGPMLTGHRSHQIGLDADIWLTQMPDRRLSLEEREKLSATSMLGGKTSVNPKVWTEAHARLIKRAASYDAVERVLVHPAIKKALCDWTDGAQTQNARWLAKVRPYWGHHYHMHIRIGCPDGSPGCRSQRPTTGDHGCGKEIDEWFALLTRPPKPPKPGTPPPKPRRELTMSDLPSECQVVLESGGPPPPERARVQSATQR